LLKIALLIATVVTFAATSGCGSSSDGPILYPVTGRVLIDGKPATGGTVSLREGGSQLQPSGVISSDGTYVVRTRDKEGAPLGSYRVVVIVNEPGARGPDGHTGLPNLIVNSRYLNESTTPLRIEVKDTPSPQHYDLAVTR
jgi:hypothetical protein